MDELFAEPRLTLTLSPRRGEGIHWRRAEFVGLMPRHVRRSDSPYVVGTFWLDDYLPEWVELAHSGMGIEEIGAHLGGARIEPVAIPCDCRDGFLGAYWARPEAYLDPAVRANISVFAKIDAAEGIARLAEDLRSGAWHARHNHLLALGELDLGYRLLVA